MTKLMPYAEYKDSGIDWLPEVPDGWQVARIKSRVRLITDRADEKSNPVALENIEGWTGRLVESATEFAAEGIRFEAGDVLFGKLRPYLAKSWSADRAGEAVGDFYVMRPGPSDNSKFLNYMTLSPEFIYIVDGSTFGSKMPRASWDFIANLRHPFPSIEVQNEIVAFLDRETAQIDDLIGKQERLIELLAEKRQATITHAVTKGLGSKAPTKPSGVPWLGDVPAHWSLPRLKDCSRVKRGRFMHRPRNAPHLYDGKHPFIQTGSIARAEGKYVTEYSQTLSEAGLETSAMMPKGTLVMAIAANIGDVAILSFDSCAPDSVLGFQPTHHANTDFLYYALTAKRDELTSEAPVTSQGNLNVERVGSVTVPLPPVEEQIEIVKMLDDRLAQMSHTATKASAMKRLLLERRSALISAAVTGKIDIQEGVA